MKIKRFVAADMRTALRMVRAEHGPDAVILSNRRTEEGVEIVAASNYDENAVQKALVDAQRSAEAEAAARFAATRMEMTVIRQRAELIAWYERRGYRLTGETRPFPLDDPRFGLPRTRDLAFVVLEKTL